MWTRRGKALACSRLNYKAACGALRLSRIAGATPGPVLLPAEDLRGLRAPVQSPRRMRVEHDRV